VLFATEEVPKRCYGEWYIRTFTASQSQKEIKQMPMVDKIYEIYTSMQLIAEEIAKVLEKGKGANAINQVIQTLTLDNLPAQEDLLSVIGPEQQTLREYMEF